MSQGNSLLLLILLLVVFFLPVFLASRRNRRQMEKLNAFRAGLAHGDEVITASGVHGRVVGLTENEVRLEIAPKVEITVERMGIVRYANEAEHAAPGEVSGAPAEAAPEVSEAPATEVNDERASGVENPEDALESSREEPTEWGREEGKPSNS